MIKVNNIKSTFTKTKNSSLAIFLAVLNGMGFTLISYLFLGLINDLFSLNILEILLPSLTLLIINIIYTVASISDSIYKYTSINSVFKESLLVFKIVINQILFGILVVALWKLYTYSINIIPIPIPVISFSSLLTPIRFYIFVWSWMLPWLTKQNFKLLFAKSNKQYNANNDTNLVKVFNDDLESLKNTYVSKLDKETSSLDNLAPDYIYYNFKNQMYAENRKNLYSYSLEVRYDKCQLNKNKTYIKKYTNDEKYKSLSNQIEDITTRFQVSNLDDLVIKFKNLVNSNIDTCLTLNEVLTDLYSNNKLRLSTDLGYLTRDVYDLVEHRVNYLQNEYSSSKLGYDGECRVNRELDNYNDEFINIKGKTFNLSKIDYFNENYTMECDNILITRHGVFVLETKNKGEYSTYKDNLGRLHSRYKLIIEEEGRWVKEYPNGSKEIWENDPVSQNRNHILKLKKIINSSLGLTPDDDDYINVKGIVVIANDNLEIVNNSIHSIVRVNNIYEEITQKHKRIYDKEKMMKIKSIIDSFHIDEHPPVRYDTIDVYEELCNLENSLKSTYPENLVSNYFKIINDTISEYISKKNIIIDKKNNKLNRYNSDSKLFRKSKRRYLGFVLTLLCVFAPYFVTTKLSNLLETSVLNSPTPSYMTESKTVFSNQSEFEAYKSEKLNWFKKELKKCGLTPELYTTDNSIEYNYYGKDKGSNGISSSKMYLKFEQDYHDKNKYEEHIWIAIDGDRAEDNYRPKKMSLINTYLADPYVSMIHKYINKYTTHNISFEKIVLDIYKAHISVFNSFDEIELNYDNVTIFITKCGYRLTNKNSEDFTHLIEG